MGSFKISKKEISKPSTIPIGKKILLVVGIFLLAFISLEGSIIISGVVGNSILKIGNPSTSAFIRRFELQNKKRVKLQWLKLNQISRNLIRAVLVAEDDAFFEHSGLDLKEMKISLELNWKKKKVVRGGSTLTMQLVKNLYLSEKKNLLRKFNEIILALDLENKVSKRRILEVYLNIVEWGLGLYGAEAASQHYFGKSAKSLDPSEAAYLAAILPNPEYFTGKGKDRAQRRKLIILYRMKGRKIPKNL